MSTELPFLPMHLLEVIARKCCIDTRMTLARAAGNPALARPGRLPPDLVAHMDALLRVRQGCLYCSPAEHILSVFLAAPGSIFYLCYRQGEDDELRVYKSSRVDNVVIVRTRDNESIMVWNSVPPLGARICESYIARSASVYPCTLQPDGVVCTGLLGRITDVNASVLSQRIPGLVTIVQL